MPTHVSLGGPVVIDPIRTSTELEETVKWLSYFTWHDAVALLVAASAYLYVGLVPGNRILAIFVTVMLAGFGVMGLATALFASPALWSTPAPYAFNLIAIIGLIAMLTDRRGRS